MPITEAAMKSMAAEGSGGMGLDHDVLSEHLLGLIGEANRLSVECLSVARANADRLLGPEKDNSLAGDARPQPSGTIWNAIDQLEDLCGGLRVALSEVERFRRL